MSLITTRSKRGLRNATSESELLTTTNESEAPTNTWSAGTTTSIETSAMTSTAEKQSETAEKHASIGEKGPSGAADGAACTTLTTGAEQTPAAQSTRTVIERRKGAASVTSTRRRDLLAREKLEEMHLQEITAEAQLREIKAQAELQQLRAKAALMRTRIELASTAGSDYEGEDEDDDQDHQVQQWLDNHIEPPPPKKTVHAMAQKTAPEQRGEAGEGGSDVAALARAITDALTAQKPVPALPKFVQDLPVFDGDSQEWLAFKAIYTDSQEHFTHVQNIARLRKSLRGRALEEVRSLLYASCEPHQVMAALERRFGRPDVLVLAELEKLKKTRPLTDSTKDLCALTSRVNNCVATVRTLKKPAYLHSPELVRQVLEKLTPVLRYRWCDYRAQQEDEEPELCKIAAFLSREADRCNAYSVPELEENRFARRQVAHTAEDPESDEATHNVTKAKVVKREQPRREQDCPQCSQEHSLAKCKEFAKLDVNRRWDVATKARACYKCLSPGHSWSTCRAKPCGVDGCRRRHNALLHKEAKQREDSVATGGTNNITTEPTGSVNLATESRAYLKIIPVELTGSKGKKAVVHALLDEGSTITLIDAELAESIGARGAVRPLTIEAVGGAKLHQEDSRLLRSVNIRGVHFGKKMKLVGARTIRDLKLTPQEVKKEDVERCPHLRAMAGQLTYERVRPKLLIGQDNWGLITSRQLMAGKANQPVASRTHLGWVLHGANGSAVRAVHMVHHASEWTREMEKLIKDNFAIEALGVQPRRPTTDVEARAVAILDSTTHRLEDGRFETGLLWKDPGGTMPDSRKQALTRLLSTEKKLARDSTLRDEYHSQMKNLVDKGYAEIAPSATGNKTWYLPHFEVRHPQKTKIRLVFDAAAKTQGSSLNDTLLAGPDLLQSLFGVLLRFRQGPVAVAGDIEEMFLQIRIIPEDRDSLRFLWREDPSRPPTEYRMRSLVFGAASSPCTAIYVKDRNAREHQDGHPEAARAIIRHHYMDDYLQSFWDIEEARTTATQVAEVHKKAQFNLRGWASNKSDAISSLQGRQQQCNKVVDIGDGVEKTLGLQWHLATDQLGFAAAMRTTPPEVNEGLRLPTKREVTSAVMAVFDPLGLAAPILIQGKKLIQELWRRGTDWDEVIPSDMERSWQSYIASLTSLRELRVARHVAHSKIGQLHVFVDASEEAYAAAAYWLSEDESGRKHVALLAGKARVTPLKPVSVPRLELQAAVLGARLAASIKEQLDLQVVSTTYWTDSTTVLSWIRAGPRTFKAFVAHRLAEIEDTSKPTEWRWVPTTMNAADDATRSLPSGFDSNHRWYQGPDFLKLSPDQYPKNKMIAAKEIGDEERRDVAATVSETSSHPVPDTSRFSSWNRLVRTTARVLQFVELLRGPAATNTARQTKKDPTWKQHPKRAAKTVPRAREGRRTEDLYIPLEPRLLRRAEALLLRASQEDSFTEDVKRAHQSLPPKKGGRLAKLDVAVDTEGVLRLRGRVGAVRGVDPEVKAPAVIDGRTRVAELIVRHYHARLQHCNHNAVANEVRQRYWVLGLRSVVKRVVKECNWCKLRRAQPGAHPYGDLPPERLHHGAPPFTCTAVDFFGPMLVTVGRRVEKRWGVLFTCLTTRAVHLELSSSLNASSMILALRRMAARRGTPRVMYSDNGTNFVAANKELRDDIRGLRTEAVNSGIRWKFIPPGAPNMGGAWERLVRAVKTALCAVLHERKPREETLHTLLTEAEHTVNARPLTEVTPCPGDPEALTPNHFLIGRSCGAWGTGDYTEVDPTTPSWRTAQRLADLFWARWLREYLPTLVARAPGGQRRNIAVGDVVLIADGTLPRNVWPRGEVVRTHKGPDGRVRVAEVRTTTGTLRRPTRRMILLEAAAAKEGDSPDTEVTASQRGEVVTDEFTPSNSKEGRREEVPPVSADNAASKLRDPPEEWGNPTRRGCGMRGKRRRTTKP